MNTITKKQYSELWSELFTYCEKNDLPDFWNLDTLDSNGQQCSENEAVYAEIEVQDFDGQHDYGFLNNLLSRFGIKLNCKEMLDSCDLCRLEEEEAPRPLKAATVDGDGEYGRIFGYQLILKD